MFQVLLIWPAASVISAALGSFSVFYVIHSWYTPYLAAERLILGAQR